MQPENDPTCIFIKSWINDLPWLKYCLTGIDRYFQSPHEIILVIDEDCEQIVAAWELDAKILVVPNPSNGYIEQQIYKLQAYQYTKCEQILYVDSDTIFHTPCSIADFMVGDRIRHYYDRYDRIDLGKCWQKPTEDALGCKVEYEYMRRLPVLHDRLALEKLHHYYPHLIPNLWKLSDNKFSEFNVIGAFAHRECDFLYYWHDVASEEPPPALAKQFWSWSGLTPAIEKEIQCLLKL